MLEKTQSLTCCRRLTIWTAAVHGTSQSSGSPRAALHVLGPVYPCYTEHWRGLRIDGLAHSDPLCNFLRALSEAGLVDDDAIQSGVPCTAALFSSVYLSSSSLSKSSIFLRGFSVFVFPLSSIAQSSEDSRVLEHDVFNWHGVV